MNLKNRSHFDSFFVYNGDKEGMNMIEKAKLEGSEDIYQLLYELEQIELPHDLFMKNYKNGLNDSNILYLVYKYESKNIAFMSFYIKDYLHHTGRTGEIVELVVLPEYRGLRVGHQMIEYIEDYAKKSHLIEIELSTSTYRKKAHLFYEAHGFEKDHYNYTKDI